MGLCICLDEILLTRTTQVFVTTKHWRKFHGYEASLSCLRTSLNRLRLDYVDLVRKPATIYGLMVHTKQNFAGCALFFCA